MVLHKHLNSMLTDRDHISLNE